MMSSPLQPAQHLDADRHLDADQLSAFMEDALPAHEREHTLAHLAVCSDCRAILVLAQPFADEAPQPEPTSAARTPWFTGWRLAWFSGWRLAWSSAAFAAAAAILTVTFYLHHPGTQPAPAKDRVNEIAVSSEPVHPVPIEPPAAPAYGRILAQRSAPPRPQVSDRVMAAPRAASSEALYRAVPGAQSIAAPVPQARDRLNNGLAASATPAPAQAMTSAARSVAPPPPAAQAAAPAASTGGVISDQASIQATAAPPRPRFFAGNSALAITARAAPLRRPLPNGLPALSTARGPHRVLALDANNSLFLSTDDGEHWQAIPAAWPGRAVRVALAAPQAAAPQAAAPAASLGGPVNINGAPAPVAAAPAPASTLSGSVTDSSGAAIPNAIIVLTGRSASTLRTDAQGHFTANLPLGTYQAEASAPGFSPQRVSAVTLAAAQPAQANFTLNPGQAAQTVTVESFTAQVQPLPLKSKAASQPAPVAQPALPAFEITTDTGEHWTSPDGLAWKPAGHN